MESRLENPVRVTCPADHYSWYTRSQMKRIGCPCCGYRFPNPAYKQKELVE